MADDAALPGTMPSAVPAEAAAAAAFDAVGVAKELLRVTRAGTLATLDRNTGHPFASLVNVATDADGSPLLLMSRLAVHTANLSADPRASILMAATGKGDALAHPRLTVLGTVAAVPRDAPDAARIARRFLSCHPKARLYAGFGDFSFFRLVAVAGHLNGGFARAADLRAADFLTPLADAAGLLDAEDGAVAHINSDHPEVARLIATRLLHRADGAWTVTGIDPDGVDLARGADTARLAFAGRVTDAGTLRARLAAVANAARAAGSGTPAPPAADKDAADRRP